MGLMKRLGYEVGHEEVSPLRYMYEAEVVK